MSSLSKEKLFSLLFHFFYLLLLASVVFAWRAVSSICFGLIMISGLFYIRFYHSKFRDTSFNILLVSCFLLFLLTCTALFYTGNMKEGISQVSKKTGIIIIPLSLYASHWFLDRNNYHKLMNYLTFFLFSASIICLVLATKGFLSTGKSSLFFYHDLVKPFGQHAIQFSLLVLFNLLFLFNCLKSGWILKLPWLYFFIFFFSGMLVLLSSKLILLLYLLWIIHYIFFQRRIGPGKSVPFVIAIATMVIVLLSTSNPFSHRFRLLLSGNQKLFLQEQFNPGVYFNGIQFRLLQWRFTGEILDEKKAWVLGVSPGDAQDLLNAKYQEKNMYTGNPGQAKAGYWNFHTHNQFLQITLQYGLAGLIVLLFFWIGLIRCAKKSRQPDLKFFVFTLLLYCFSDAPFETQYGMILLIFLPVFSYISHRFKEELPKQPNRLATK